MLVSHTWLMELSRLALAPAEVARRFTAAGLEVESRHEVGVGFDDIVVAEVRATERHPQRDKLTLVTVFDGESEQQVVCGASNLPPSGGLVAFARLGATLPGGLRIEERKLGGVVSRGMICSEKELEIGADEEGILIIDATVRAAPGTPLSAALSLHDTIYELGLTPNRADCLGHVGLARELCALLEAPFEWPRPMPVARVSGGEGPFAQQAGAFSLHELVDTHGAITVPGTLSAPITVDNAAPERCPRYGAALVTAVTIAPSPFAVRYRLHNLGVRSICNVVDATNLILLGFGHPIHAFDLNEVRGQGIVVRLARQGESLTTLDGVARTLTADDLLVCDSQGGSALAGVMGGATSEISSKTRNVLIECAYFEPRSVRRTSKRTGLHTDSSHRFERGVDPEGVRPVLAHAAALIAQLAGGALATDALDVYPNAIERKRVVFRAARAEHLLGTDVDLPSARGVLERLGCDVQPMHEGGDLEVALPTFRPDLGREVDLIEEYARVRGYDAIPTRLPVLRAGSDGSASEVAFLRRVREACAATGLTEAINFAFLAPGELQKARVSMRSPRLTNPMSEERSVLRTSLLPGLLGNLVSAQRHQQKRLGYFEAARVFSSRDAGELPDERYELSILLWGLRQSWYDERERMDFYDLKGAVQNVVHALLGAHVQTLPEEGLSERTPYLHPKRRAAVYVDGKSVGVLGEVHPDVLDAFDLEGRPVYANLDIAALLAVAHASGARRVQPLPRFPASTRDIAVVVGESQAADDVARALHEVAGELAQSVQIFDIYRGAPVPEGHKSLAFHVVYRDPRATLTDKLVDDAHARVTRAAEERFGASVRK